MKATLCFDLPDESCAFDDACKGSQYRSCLEEVLAHIRTELKYKTPSKAQIGALERVRQIIIDTGCIPD